MLGSRLVSAMFPWLLAPAVACAAVTVTDLGGGQFQLEFRYSATGSDVRTVHVAGSFNNWDPTAQALTRDADAGTYRARVVVSAGRHEYKFVINGSTWMTDVDNSQRTPEYANAVAWAGVDPEVPPPVAPPPADMPGLAAFPDYIAALAGRPTTTPPSEAGLARFFQQRPMPVFEAETVSFVYAGEEAEPPILYIDAHGVRWSFPMQSLGADRGLYALTLQRKGFPPRWAYRFNVLRAGRWTLIRDPHAWSVTSRGNRPASAGVAAGPDRGRIELIPDFAPAGSPLPARDLYIYLPPGYADSLSRRYPVLYLHDGQNCWDDPVEPFGHGGWRINLIADELINQGRIAPFIGVGLANTPQRLQEYGPGDDIRAAVTHPYIQLLVREVKPLIDRRYRTRPEPEHTALMGSSMGGAISLQAALLCPATFGQAACLSTAFMFKDAAGRDYGDLLQAVGKQPVRLYLDSGTAGPGEDGRAATRAMVKRLRDAGWREGEDLLHFEDVGGLHNERAWRARVHRPLMFLFGDR